MIRAALAAAVCALALALVACGDDDDKSDGSTTSRRPAQGTDLAAIKDYLLSHTERLVGDTGAVRERRGLLRARQVAETTSTTPRCSTSTAPKCAGW